MAKCTQETVTLTRTFIPGRSMSSEIINMKHLSSPCFLKDWNQSFTYNDRRTVVEQDNLEYLQSLLIALLEVLNSSTSIYPPSIFYAMQNVQGHFQVNVVKEYGTFLSIGTCNTILTKIHEYCVVYTDLVRKGQMHQHR